MARFKKKGSNELPAMNSGSMSDIVFILLFFFMVISNMREATVLVRLTVQEGLWKTMNCDRHILFWGDNGESTPPSHPNQNP